MPVDQQAIRINCLAGWKEYVSARRKKKSIQYSVQKVYSASLLHRYFLAIHKKYLNRAKWNTIETSAMKIRQDYTLKNLFSTWSRKFQSRKWERQKSESADDLHSVFILRRCWRNWLEFIDYCRYKKLLLKKAREVYADRTIDRTWHVWTNLLLRRQKVKQMENLAGLVREEHQKRIYLGMIQGRKKSMKAGV